MALLSGLSCCWLQRLLSVICSYACPPAAELGAAAQKQLKEEGVNVEFHQLDISDRDSIESFAKWLETKHGGLDILVRSFAC
jgi:NAD(P)-dependent dehydrogenase (short-subunit alcohol dehydrogenase family)